MNHTCACGATRNVPPQLIGKRMKCAKCGALSIVEPPPPQPDPPGIRRRRIRFAKPSVTGPGLSLGLLSLALILLFVCLILRWLELTLLVVVPLSILALLCLVAGAVVGVIHVVLGIRRHSAGSIVVGTIGGVLNAGLAAIGVLVILVALTLGNRKAQLASCEVHLKQLWAQERTWATRYGGLDGNYPQQTGRDFWLALTRSQPPLLEPDSGLLSCPASGGSYWGPGSDVNGYDEMEPIGMCADHGDSVLILLKSGSVIRSRKSGLFYDEAIELLKRD